MTPEALARLHSDSFRIPPAWRAQDFAQMLSDPACILLARSQGAELLAFALIRVAADEAELLTLATAQAARRAGHARSLLAEGLHLAATRGARACFLEVATTNLAARALYESAGFRQVGLRPNYFRAATQAPLDAIVYKVDIGQ